MAKEEVSSLKRRFITGMKDLEIRSRHVSRSVPLGIPNESLKMIWKTWAPNSISESDKFNPLQLPLKFLGSVHQLFYSTSPLKALVHRALKMMNLDWYGHLKIWGRELFSRLLDTDQQQMLVGVLYVRTELQIRDYIWCVRAAKMQFYRFFKMLEVLSLSIITWNLFTAGLKQGDREYRFCIYEQDMILPINNPLDMDSWKCFQTHFEQMATAK